METPYSSKRLLTKYFIVEKVKILGEQLGTEHLFPKNSCSRGFHVQVDLKNIQNFDVKHPPSICKNVSKIIMKLLKINRRQ